MTKFFEPFEDTVKLFNQAIITANLDRFANIKILTNNKLKEPYKCVKANDLTNYESGVDAYIILNEEIFDQLNDEQKYILVEEAVCGIHYDTEKDKLIIRNHDFKAHTGILAKYGAKKCIELDTLIKLLYSKDANSETPLIEA